MRGAKGSFLDSLRVHCGNSHASESHSDSIKMVHADRPHIGGGLIVVWFLPIVSAARFQELTVLAVMAGAVIVVVRQWDGVKRRGK
ncbi:MAG: hypothetical protein EHM80_15310 [Nitrospiraceae bacterium]|nr:MAG: hypothetical protein EHM80_17365 [Nitrospiraceae bacterium]RPH76103.1 MAG: hypothetical protein EHM80_15310 [Nitrospiraceae bacterium]